jgi:hypothetical protein
MEADPLVSEEVAASVRHLANSCSDFDLASSAVFHSPWCAISPEPEARRRCSYTQHLVEGVREEAEVGG